MNTFINDNQHLFDYGYKTAIGKRPTMEDCLSVSTSSHHPAIFGIFDGHGGSQCSEFCAQHFPSIFNHKYQSNNEFKSIIQATLNDLNAECISSFPDQGTTMSVVCLLSNDDICIANLGDSKVMIYQNNQKPICATVQHRVSNKQEEQRLLQKNAWCIYAGRICGRLSLSRCIGNKSLNDCIIREPNIYKTKKKEGMKIVIASDGIWDFIKDDEVTKIIWSSNTPQEAAQKIQETAAKHQSRDNMSVLVLFL